MQKGSTMQELVKVNTNLSVELFYNQTKELLKLQLLSGSEDLQNKYIEDRAVNRPALALMGYFKHFANKRLQYLGCCELSYLLEKSKDEQISSIKQIYELNVPCFVISDKIELPEYLRQTFEELKLPLFSTSLTSVEFVEKTTIFLDEYFAPSTVINGTLMEMNGCGVLIQNLPASIRSTCIMALLERGYSLVADEVVCITYAHNGYLIGKSKELSYGFLEFRGIGLVNVTDIFGLRVVRPQSVIDFVIKFDDELQDELSYGEIDELKYKILDQELPMILLPVNNNGNDAHRQIEIAATLHHLKHTGNNPTDILNERLIKHMMAKM